MSKKLEAIRERQEAVSLLGKTLARRSGSNCEICESSGVPLRPWELPPAPEEPDPDEAVFLCDGCRVAAEGGRLDGGAWRLLEQVVWSSVPAVQVLAVRLLRRLADGDTPWARDALDALYLEPEVLERVDRV